MSINVSHRARVRTQAQVQATLDRALVKSDEQARIGNLPRLVRSFSTPDGVRQVWSVSSRTTGGVIYMLDTLVGTTGVVESLCECQATGWCWHRSHVERAIDGAIGAFVMPPTMPRPRYGNVDVFGPAAD